MKLSTGIILSFTILATGCTIQPIKQPDRVGPGTFYAKWHRAIFDGCSDRAAEVTLELVKKKYSEGVVIMESDVGRIHKYLTEKCSRRSGITI